MEFRVSAAVTVVSRVSAVVLMGLAGVVIARVLGPVGQGLVASLVAVVGIVLQFGNLGVYAANIRFVGADRRLFGGATGNSIVVGLVLGVVSFILLSLFALVYPGAYGEVPLVFLMLYAVSIPFSLLIILFQGLILAVDRIRTYNLFILVRALMVFFGSIVLLLFLGGGVLEIILLLVFVEVVVCLLYVYASNRVEKLRLKFDYSLLARMVKYGLRVYVATQMMYLVLKFDILLVNYYLGLGSAGVYSISAKIGDLLYLAPATIALVYFPRATALKERAREFTNKVLLSVSVLMLAACVVLFLIVKPVVLLLYGGEYAGAILPLRVLIPGIFFISLATILMNYFASKDMPAFAVYTPVAGLFINILLNALLIPGYGIAGAAASSTIVYTLMFLMLFGYYLRK